MCFDAACRLILSLHDEIGNLVARCQLPYNFIVYPNGNANANANANANGNDTGSDEHTEPQQFPVPNHPSVPVSEHRTPESPTNVHPFYVNEHPHFDPNYPVSVLRRLAPAEGPMSGGQTILLLGSNFPPPLQQIVYARFGNVPVATV